MTKKILSYILTLIAGFCLGVLTLTYYPQDNKQSLLIAAQAGPEGVSTSHEMALKLSPVFQQKLEEYRPKILSHARFPERPIIRAGWPLALREIPTLVEMLIDLIAEYMHKLTLANIVDWLEEAARKRKDPEAGKFKTELRLMKGIENANH